jgi:hypothetical protein
MHGAINVKSPNNTNKWQMGFNSAFKGLIHYVHFVGILKVQYVGCKRMHGMENFKMVS